MNTRISQLEAKIAGLRKKLEAAERLREIVCDNPDLLDSLLPEIATSTPAAMTEPAVIQSDLAAQQKKDKTLGVYGGEIAQGYFDLVAGYLAENNNQPTSVQKLAAAVGLKEHNVTQVVYRTHAVLFDDHLVEGHKGRRVWSLKPNWREIYQESKKNQQPGPN